MNIVNGYSTLSIKCLSVNGNIKVILINIYKIEIQTNENYKMSNGFSLIYSKWCQRGIY